MNADNNLIVIKQLPIIEERLREISMEAQCKISEALTLVCSDENIQLVKKFRADLRKDFNDLEDKRKEVNRLIAEKIKPFTDAYKEYITDVYLPADNELKGRIAALENEKKDQKRQEVEDYFNEYLQDKNIDFVEFSRANINVTLTASVKNLKEQAKAFIDRICDDLALLDTQEHKSEILVEYKQTLNASAAITTVTARHKAIEAEQNRRSEAARIKMDEAEVVKKVETAVTLSPPVEVPQAAPTTDDSVIAVRFTVKHTRLKMRELKQYLEEGGFEIL